MTDLDEKIQALRNVGIFAQTSEAALTQVAWGLIPVEIRVGETIFMAGDPGDSLYVIAKGKVRVHDGELFFNYLCEGDVFGEMSVLDAEPRSASVTAIVDTLVFRLDQAHLYHLMADQIDVARGIIRVLCGYLRDRIADQNRDFAYIRQVSKLTAAAQALETGVYTPDSDTLDEVTQRGDALGNLARVFQNMAREVYAREQQLKQQVDALRIEIDRTRQAQQVAEITESDYFQDLQKRVKALRGHGDANADTQKY